MTPFNMARFEHVNKVRRKELKPEKNGVHLFLESGIHCAGILNPQHRIQNPRLSWIPLHGAIFFGCTYKAINSM